MGQWLLLPVIVMKLKRNLSKTTPLELVSFVEKRQWTGGVEIVMGAAGATHVIEMGSSSILN